MLRIHLSRLRRKHAKALTAAARTPADSSARFAVSAVGGPRITVTSRRTECTEGLDPTSASRSLSISDVATNTRSRSMTPADPFDEVMPWRDRAAAMRTSGFAVFERPHQGGGRGEYRIGGLAAAVQPRQQRASPTLRTPRHERQRSGPQVLQSRDGSQSRYPRYQPAPACGRYSRDRLGFGLLVRGQLRRQGAGSPTGTGPPRT